MSRGGWFASLATGAALWIAAAVISGRTEPWDAEHYWSLWLPLAIALSLIAGWLFPERAWRWGLAIMLMQLPVMLAAGAGLGLLPLGIILLLLLSVPAMLAARIGAGLGRWLARGDPA